MAARRWRVFPSGGERNFHNPPLDISALRQQTEAARFPRRAAVQTPQYLWSNQHTTSVIKITHQRDQDTASGMRHWLGECCLCLLETLAPRTCKGLNPTLTGVIGGSRSARGRRKNDGLIREIPGVDFPWLRAMFCCRYQRLSQAQTAIPGGHFFLCKHFKSSFGQPCLESLRQVEIVKGPATQANAVKGSFLP